MSKFLDKLTYAVQYRARNNPIADAYYKKQRDKLLTYDFLNSSDYEALFLKFTGQDKATFKQFLDDAEQRTRNFNYRHLRFLKILGAWRWKGLFHIKEKLLPLVYQKNAVVIDFGGANGPVTKEAVIVDFAQTDIFGRPVKYKNLDAVDFKADYIVSSHTLEHIEPLDEVLKQLKGILKEEGKLILNLPAYSCVRWQSGVHTNRAFNDHKWSMYLSGTEIDPNIQNPLAIDEVVSRYFTIDDQFYTGDNSIIIMAH